MFFSLLSFKVWFIRLKFKIYKMEPWLSIVCPFWFTSTGYFWNLEMLLLTECASHISISFLHSAAVHVHIHMSLLWWLLLLQSCATESSGSSSHKQCSISAQRPAWTVTVLQTLVPYIVMSVASVDIVISRITSSTPIMQSKLPYINTHTTLHSVHKH